MRLYVKKYWWIPLLLFILVMIPCMIELVVNNGIFGWKLYTSIFNKTLWFSFIGSYIGTIATVFLGAIAIWQNKRYKELSDKSSKESFQMQDNIKLLTEKMSRAIETLRQIEESKYFPIIEKMSCHYYGMSRDSFLKEFNEDYEIQQNIINLFSEKDIALPIIELYDKYNSYSFLIQNTSEKAVRHFNCHRLRINGKEPSYFIKQDCDILPGQYVLVTIINFPEFKMGEMVELEMDFTLNNLIHDKYIIHSELMILFDEDCFSTYVSHFTLPEIYAPDEEENKWTN